MGQGIDHLFAFATGGMGSTVILRGNKYRD